ncbi:aldehyde dehydrogenase (NADP(+)) [Thermasporomyces composti]|uniref:NADP-dependent aldehyde dehydrogenase n=1 Tax=Thermasporomyces composti TaxID=696763 RepID=A0A3D9V2E4_THECX|nr:aldehyde dehydrogenase (NADP(+)) [Thermasporomyces composti]REF35962.1 NADP-dependent aldehyde dehydrogenase [Thermasporomyces composti]
MTVSPTTVEPTTSEQLEAILAAAAAASEPLGSLLPNERAPLLRAVADALDAAADELVPLAMEESHLPEGRLRGELTRTTFQLRLFAEVLEEGSYLEATIDTADPDWGMGPRPDVRRMLVPLGPTLVYAASNFPFAFSVAGGDTASALAAGCPVIVKAHSGHPRLSARTGTIVKDALAQAGAPHGTFDVIFGSDQGVQALRDPRIKAGSFTGSIPGGRALFDIASGRPDPIPFYGELGSLNPVFVFPGAAKARPDEIATGFCGSFTLGVGQFCTKPGLLFVPVGSAIVDAVVAAARDIGPAPLLNDRIARGYEQGLRRLVEVEGVQVVLHADPVRDLAVAPTLVKTTVPNLLEHKDELLEECFGPASIIVEYADLDELTRAAEAFGGNLTATVHAEESETDVVAPLLTLLRERAGRLLWNGWPTGVSVTYAMHHGGPWPATTASIHTSVGTTAIRRFLRPVCYQQMPAALLPVPLRDENVLGIPRRVNGVLTKDDVRH